MTFPKRRIVRVILGQLGPIVRMTAAGLGISAEGDTREEAWRKFLEQLSGREDSAWFRFDVGPNRREEIEKGLDIPENEDWSVLFVRAED